MDYDAHSRLVHLLEAATVPEMQSLDAATLNSAKTMLRESEESVRMAHELLFFKLKKDNAQVRFLALSLIDEIFRRSAVFRALLIPLLETFLELTLGMRTDKPLPEPRVAARRLQKKAIEVVEGWNDKFGSRYRQVRLAYRYLRDVLRYDFPNLPARAREAERARREAERAAEQEAHVRYEEFEEAWEGCRTEAQALLRQLDGCLALLTEEGPGGMQEEGAAGPGFDDGGMDVGWEAGGGVTTPLERVETLGVLESLRDLYRALCHQHLRASQGWLATLMQRGRGAAQQRRGRHEALLREVLALRGSMLEYKGRCEALGVELRRTRAAVEAGGAEEAEDADMWEEGEVPSNQGLADAQLAEVGSGDEATEEERALGLIVGDEAVASGAKMHDAVRDMVDALGGASMSGKETVLWTPLQSNLVLKPGGRGLARSDGFVASQKAKGGGQAGAVGGAVMHTRPYRLASVPHSSAPGGLALEAKSMERHESEREPSVGGVDAEVPRSSSSSKGSRDAPHVAVPPPASRPARDPAAPKEGRPRPPHLARASTATQAGGAGSVPPAAAAVASSATPSSLGSSPLSALRASAPVVPWGSYLDHWGAEGSVPVDARGLVIENHWGAVDREATLPAERLLQMSMRATYYQPEQKKEVKACRAPLPGGGLCPRRDLVRCPLHGPVIPRDDQGRPATQLPPSLPPGGAASAPPLLRGIDVECDLEGGGTAALASSAQQNGLETSDDGGEAVNERAALLHDVAQQAVANVRQRDEGEAAEKQAARKKARVSAQERVRDRAHNEAVLREAAVRGSRQRLGDELGGQEGPAEGDGSGGRANESGREKRRARGGRAQLSVRQRIERRLLNARVRNATTSVLEAEESKRAQTMNANRWENR